MTQQEFFNRYKYSIRTDKVGGGAFGTVYRAFDEVMNREVAIKVSEVKIMGGKEFSLKDEFDAIKDIPVHPNIANYEELVTLEMPNGIFDYAIMQFYKDGNLSSFIKSNPSLAQKEQVAFDLLEGIHHLHKHTIVHRDLKPGNILIVKRGDKVIPVITDFGLSKQAEMEGQSRFSNSFGGGTLKYSSPEQLKAEKLRLNTDLWAYGVIVHEIFTGKNLFMAQGITGASAEAEKEIYEQIIGVDISEMLNKLPTKWKKVAEQCLIRDGAKRIKSAAAVKELIINGGTSSEESESYIDNETIILDAAPEEMVDDQTVIDDGKTVLKEKPKKEPVKETPPKKEQAKQQKEFKPKFAYDAKGETKKKNNILIALGSFVGALVLGSVLWVQFSSSEGSDWQAARSNNTLEGFQHYLNIYPDGEHIEDAKEYLLWLSVKDDESTDSINLYLNKYPGGKLSSEALETNVWLSTKHLNTIDSYKSYLDSHPSGIFKTEAENQITVLNNESASKEGKAWNIAKNSNTIKAYNTYLKEYENGKYSHDANSRINELKKKLEGSPIENYEKGLAFYGKGEYYKAAQYFFKSANQGNRDAQFYLGAYYDELYPKEKGKKLKIPAHGRYKELLKWYTKAADQGHIKSQYKVAYIYYQAEKIVYDNEKIPADYSKALSYALKAAKKGEKFAMRILASMYGYGHGTQKDKGKSEYWLNQTIKNGSAKDLYLYADVYYDGAFNIEKNYEKALKYFELSFDKGYLKASNMIGIMYAYGAGTTKDFDKATEVLEEAANDGFILAYYTLGELHYKEGIKNKSEEYKSVLLKLALTYFEIYGLSSDDGTDKDKANQKVEELKKMGVSND